MAPADKSVRIYEELARCYDRQPQVRDRFLVLASDAALTVGLVDEAERLRAELLRVNPQHMVKPFASMSQAMQSADFKNYVEGLRRSYPRTVAENLLVNAKAGAGEDWVPQPMPQSAPVNEGAGAYSFQAEIATQRQAPAAKITRSTSADRTQPLPGLPVQAVASAPAPRLPAAVPVEKPRPPRSNGPAPQPASVFIPVEPTNRERQRMAGRWVADALFLLVLVAALALLIYTLAKSITGR